MARRTLRQLSRIDQSYLLSRVLLAASLCILFATGLVQPTALHGMRLMFELGVAAEVALAVGVVIGYLFLELPTRTVLLSALLLDLVAGGALVVALHAYQDPMYAWFVGVVVIDALALRRRESDWTSLAVWSTYLGGHIAAHGDMNGAADYILIAFKSATLLLAGHFVSQSTHQRIEREHQIERGRDSIEDLNDQLQRRLAELNAVAEITEVVHSSLEFEVIGPLVIEIVRKVIGVSACSLLVLDKARAETLFSASAGVVPPPAHPAVEPQATGAGGAFDGDAGTFPYTVGGGEFACATVLDHGQVMVVFCAPAEDMDRMRTEDRLMLQAVASEIVVAAENAELYKLTKRLSITDELTGLYNYRHMQQRLESEFERATRFSRPVSLLMIDADDFKEYNDRYGHPAGDRALQELGRLLKDMVREVDIAARYGGEEFAVILPETDASGAFVVAEKIREAVAGHAFIGGDGVRDVYLSVSIGLANYPAHASDRESLLRQADGALYQAKHQGRDRVRTAGPAVTSIAERREPAEDRRRAEDDIDVEERPA